MDTPYSEPVLEHFARPRNLGRLADANGRGVAGDLRGGDTRVEIAVRVEHDRIVAARFRTFGCAAAIAASSMATTLIDGRTVEEVAGLTSETIVAALGGLPPAQGYAPAMVVDAIQAAIADWQRSVACGA